MKMNIKNAISAAAVILGILAAAPSGSAQGAKDANTFGNTVRFDKTVHDFGDVHGEERRFQAYRDLQRGLFMRLH